MPSFHPVHLARRFVRAPAFRRLREHAHRQEFLAGRQMAGHFGLFETFAQARAWVPPSPEYDHAALAKEYVEVRCHRIFAYDYPVLWWLKDALASGARRVLDIGGSVGVHRFAYSPFIDMPDDLQWTVAEVPSMCRIGEDLAKRNGVAGLDFRDDDLRGVVAEQAYDVWLAAGAIHCIEHGRPNHLLERAVHRPDHILLNKMPIYDGDDFVTVQSLGEGCFSPLYVYNRQRLVADIEACGYRLVDSWDVPERGMWIPEHPERSFPYFSGLYFRSLASLAGAGGAENAPAA